jgi:hypothetical protein
MKRYITKAFLATLILAGVVSCQKEEDRVFDKPVSERLSDQEKKLQDLLLSSEYGWKVVYFTAPGDLGGFTYLMNFMDARNVAMVSDFNASGFTKEVSEYAIQQRATTSVVFTTRAKIHDLSDPTNSPYESGKGYYGEYQFGYYGNTENEIHFKTAKQDIDVVFVKATKEDWDKFGEHSKMFSKMNSTESSYFRVVDITSGGVKKAVDFTNYASVRMIELAQNDIFSDEAYGVAYTADGILLKPGMTVDGKVISNFKFDEDSNSFIGKEGDVQVAIKYAKDPVVWTDMSYKKLLAIPGNRESTSFTFRTATGNQLLGSSVTSPFMQQKVEELGKNPLTGQYNLEQIDFRFNTSEGFENGNGNYVGYKYKGKTYYYNFKFEDKGTKVKVIQLGWDFATPKEIVELNTLILGEELYIRRDANIQYINPVITFISTKAPIAFPTWDVNKPNVF